MTRGTWMTAKEFEAGLVRLGLSNWPAAATRLGISRMQLYRLRKGEIKVPRQTADLLRCWLASGAVPAE